MATETELLESSGLVALLRDPNTGDVLHLNFPPNAKSIPLEIHMPARVIRAKLEILQDRNQHEFNVGFWMDTRTSLTTLPPGKQEPDACYCHRCYDWNLNKPIEGQISGVGPRPAARQVEAAPLPDETIVRTETNLTEPVTSVIPQIRTETSLVEPLKVEPSVPPQPAQPPVQGAETSEPPVQPQAAPSGAPEAVQASSVEGSSKAPGKEPPKSGGRSR